MKALPVLDPKAAAIDVGSERLHVSIAGDTPQVFGAFTGELERLCAWFKEQGNRACVRWRWKPPAFTGSISMECWSVYLVLQLISEVGTEMARWPSEKHFVSWLGRAGGRKQSGKRKGSVKAHRNRAGRLFCAAARALGQSVDKALGGFYRRLRGRLGGLAANVALARKLALLFHRLLRYGMAYVEKGLKSYEAKVLETETRLLRKLARKQGFALIPTTAD